MRYLGLDLGSRTIGLALSDKTGFIASSYCVLRHNNQPEACLIDLKAICQREEVEALVLGYPKNMNNTLGPRAKASEAFKVLLEQELKLPVFLVDERLSTVAAEKTLLLGDTSRKKRKKVIDAVAATVILQSYLDLKKEK